MKIASTRKSLLIVIFFLLIIDVIILFFFVSKNRPVKTENRDHKQSGMSSMLTEEVHFTPEQIGKYQELRKEQFTEIKPFFGGIRRSKDNFYSLLYEKEVSDSIINVFADSISINQKKLDVNMFHYFKSIRNICTEEQLPKFDSSIKKVVMRMTGSRKNKSKNDTEKPLSNNNK